MSKRNLVRKTISTLAFQNVNAGYYEEPDTIENVSYRFESGNRYWIKGNVGEGKSTILKLLAGLVVPREGTVLINNEEMGEFSFEEFLPYRLNIGYSFDFGGLLSNRTIYENLALPLLYHKLGSSEEIIDRVNTVLQLFDIEQHKNYRPASVTGGVRKTACVARAIVLNPSVLILDEPTTGMPPRAIERLVTLLDAKKTDKDFMVFITSRNEDFGRAVGDKMVSIQEMMLREKAA